MDKRRLKTRVAECERAGWAHLKTKFGGFIVVPAVCQTWRCGRCSKGRQAYASMRAEYGSICLESPADLKLITLTYGLWESADVVTAQSALADFRRFAQRLRRQLPKFRWFRVPEKTKKGQIHWHLITSDFNGSKLEAERIVRDAWAMASRKKGVINNYVVDVSETIPSAASTYVTKYLLKGMLQGDWLLREGFYRRWTCSRDWPKPEHTRLRGTVHDIWTRNSWLPFHEAEEEVAIGRKNAAVSKWAELVGNQLVETLQRKYRARVIRKRMEKYIAPLSQTGLTNPNPDGH